jgi:hypothetical protein
VTDVAALAGAALALAVSLLVTIPVPWGGAVPLGFSLIIALPALVGPWAAAADVAGLALALFALRAQSHPERPWVPAGVRTAAAMALAGAGAAGVELLAGGEPHVLASASASAGAVLAGEVVLAALHRPGVPRRLRSALPVYLTIGCAAVLFAVAVSQVGVALASVAVLPLVVTRFAFRRYAEASTTLHQTVQALGLVPELAGLAPLGHSERTSWYASAVAHELGFDRPTIDRIVIATRLHHLGAVRADDHAAPTTPTDVAEAGARVLRESGFPAEVADLLQTARADGHGSDAATLAAAVVRVAAAFDHAVGDDLTNLDRGIALVSTTSLDPIGRRAAAALLAVVATNPDLVPDAITAGARFREAADGLDLSAMVAEHGGADVLPFTHRRA